MGYAHAVESLPFTDLDARPVARISVEEALACHRAGQRVAFVDARHPADWKLAIDKLPGAQRLSPDPDDTLPILPAGRMVVTYCSCPREASASAAARVLRAGGYESVHVLAGGLRAWRRAGGPVEPV